MKKGVISQMFNALTDEAGGNQKIAGKQLATKIEELLNSSNPSTKIEPKDFQFAQLAHELIPNMEELKGADVEEFQNAVRSSQFPTISKVVIHKTIMDSYNLYMEGMDEFVTESDSTRTTEETVAGFTESENLEMRLEGMSYEETNFGEKNVKLVMADFGRMISITREALYNDRTGQLLNNAKKFGEKGGLHRAKMITQTLECLPRTAFKEGSGASKAFIYNGTAVQQANFFNATNHTAIDGRTNVNLKTSNGLTDYASIQNALKLFTAMKDSQGDEIAVMPTKILVHPDNEVKAWQILNSASYMAVGPTTAGLADTRTSIPVHIANPYGPGGLAKFGIKSTRFLNSATDWYIGKFEDQLLWLWAYRPATAALAATAEKAFTNNITLTYKFSYHGGCGNVDYLNVVRNTA